MLPHRLCLPVVGIAALVALPQPVRAQTTQNAVVIADGMGIGTIPLDGPWQFHTGDDMAWANPAFDDSGWEQLTADKPWGEQGHPNNGGYGWYRRLIEYKAGGGKAPDLAVYFPSVQDAYEVYWNGVLVGRFGKLPPHPFYYNYYHGAPAMPFLLGPARSGELAVRIWKSPPVTDGTPFQGGFVATPVLGNAEAIARYKSSLEYEWLRSSQFAFALNSLYALAALLAFLVWLRDRKQALLFWMTWYCFAFPVIFLDFFTHFPITRDVQLIVFQPVMGIRDVSLWFLLLILLRLDENPGMARWVRRLAWIQFLLTSMDAPVCIVTLSGVQGWWRPAQRADVILTIFYTLIEALPLVLIVYAVARRRGLDPVRWLVAGLAFVTEMNQAVWIASEQGRGITHSTLADKINAPLFDVFGSAVNMQTLANTLLLFAMIYAVYRYTTEERRKQATLRRELENARAVQQVLIPETIPEVRGFAIESFYKPAGEVGGDFFQILPTANGGVLAVIGDVSGKGMPAAMTVSLLVGTVRTLAHYTESPAAILTAMNVRMLGRSKGGFTTCLVLRADADGALTVANAGHIAPYIAGRELPLENGLPLGLSEGATYSESKFKLEQEEQLTLLTDGVVEAREKTGALFGFERTQAIATESAHQIAKTAEQFGQDDDITVLTLTRRAIGDASLAKHTVPVLSPA